MDNELNNLLGFDPSQIDALSCQNNSYYSGDDFFKRELNYPIDKYYTDNFKSINDPKSIVMYVYNQLVCNSIDSISWLRNTQYSKKSDKEDKAHENKKLQILTIEFQTKFISKIDGILKLTQRLFDMTETYEVEYKFASMIKDKFINYICGNSDGATKLQTSIFVDGLIKIIWSARWDYNTKTYIMENEPCSNKYILNNGKWIKTNG